MTAKGNIAIAQYIHGDGFDPHRFDVVTKMLGLEGRLHHRPSEMSGGEQQRVAIARAIINEPKILLADEPTGNLDTKNSDIVLDMLRRLNKDLGQTIVMITHNPEATTYSDRVVHMRDGIIVDGSPGGLTWPSLGQILSNRMFFWSYERGTWQYDVAVILILVFVLLTPRRWFRDQPQVGLPANTSQVELLLQDRRNEVYRVDAQRSGPSRTHSRSAKRFAQCAAEGIARTSRWPLLHRQN